MPLALIILLGIAPSAYGHGLLEGHLTERLPIWGCAVLLAAMWGLYYIGQRRVPPHRGEALWFHAGMVVAALATFGPFDGWAETSTAMHMVQHMLYMIIVAPLWALARPLPQWQAALRGRGRRVWHPILKAGRYPTAAALLHALAIWGWHAPKPYQLALDNLWWHVTEHICFLFTGWLLWWSCLHASHARVPQALLALLLTLMHTGLLGALLNFSTQTLYHESGDLSDQQLAGLIMWVPGSLAYMLGLGWIAWRWLSRQWRRTSERAT